MKNSLYIVLALLAGLVLGNWSVQSDLRKARKEITAMKADLSRRERRESSLQNITSMLRVPEPAPATDTNRPRRTFSRPTLTNATTTSQVATSEVPAARTRDSFQEQMKSAAELWKTRSALARNSLLSNLSATPVQTQMFDQTITNMNQQLSEKIRQWTDYLKQQPEVTPETGVRMMNDLSGTVIAAYDELDRVLATGWREQAGPQFQLFDFINPEVVMPLGEVEGAFRGGHHRWPAGTAP